MNQYRKLKMRKLIIIAGGILLLINQGAVINSQEFRASIKNTEIIVKQGDILKIAKAERINAIVNPTNFNLDANMEIERALQLADPQWYSDVRQKLLSGKSRDFGEKVLGTLLSFKTETVSLAQQGISHIISTVGPKGDDLKWETMLKQAYLDSLFTAGNAGGQIVLLSLQLALELTHLMQVER